MKTIKWSSVLLLTIMFAFAPAQSWAKKKILLRYNLKKGTEYTLKTKVDQNILMKAMNKEINSHNVIDLVQSLKVTGVQSDEYTLSNVIDDMVMDVSSMGMNMHIDSSDPSTFAEGREKMVGAMMTKVIGKSYTITINKLGKVTSVNLGDLAKTLAALGDKSDQTAFTIYPENKVSEGDSWETTVDAGKGLKVKAKYTLKKISGHTAELKIDGTVTSDKSNDKVSNVSGIQNGTIYVDINTGMVTKGTINQEVKMDVSQNGMNIPLDITSIITLDVKKKL